MITAQVILYAGRQDGQLDPVTASQLHDIQQQKAAAVAREDYDEAKRLKQVLLPMPKPSSCIRNDLEATVLTPPFVKVC